MKLQTIYNRICKLALQGDRFVVTDYIPVKGDDKFYYPTLNMRCKLLNPWFKPLEGREARTLQEEYDYYRFKKNVSPSVLYKKHLRQRLQFLGAFYVEEFYNFIMCLGNSTNDSERYKYMFEFAAKHKLDDSYARIF